MKRERRCCCYLRLLAMRLSIGVVIGTEEVGPTEEELAYHVLAGGSYHLGLDWARCSQYRQDLLLSQVLLTLPSPCITTSWAKRF